MEGQGPTACRARLESISPPLGPQNLVFHRGAEPFRSPRVELVAQVRGTLLPGAADRRPVLEDAVSVPALRQVVQPVDVLVDDVGQCVAVDRFPGVVVLEGLVDATESVAETAVDRVHSSARSRVIRRFARAGRRSRAVSAESGDRGVRGGSRALIGRGRVARGRRRGRGRSRPRTRLR